MTTYQAPGVSIPFYNRAVFSQDTAPNDYPVLSLVTKAVTGYVYDVTGAAVVGATVKLLRVSDDFLCGTTTSDSSGVYSFTRDYFDPNTYYIVAYSVVGGTTQIHGTSDRSLVPA